MPRKNASLPAAQNQRQENPAFFISILGYQEEGEWVAHALEMDLIGIGDTWEEARAELVGTVHAHISIARDKNDPSLLFRLAPEELLEKYRQAVRADKSWGRRQ